MNKETKPRIGGKKEAEKRKDKGAMAGSLEAAKDERMPKLKAGGSFVELIEQLTVAYKRERGFYQACALQFDLVGTGKTRRAALQDLRESFAEYVEELILSTGPVQFYFPSDAQEWNNPDKEFYCVKVEFATQKAASKSPKQLKSIRELLPFSGKSIKSIDLQPIACA